ncbi:glutathione S-transferase N-terminal domain-containing protein [soil metagenome]
MNVLTRASLFAASAPRVMLGRHVGAIGPRPEKRLELYEFEACPFCRKVREALTMLDLEVLVKPTPKGGERFRPEGGARGGKKQFPLLVDPNEDLLLYESDAIIDHLYARYGAGPAPLAMRLGPINTLTSSLASVARAGHGGRARKSRAPAEPLELWSFELSPYCRLARETLCELELPYVLHNLGKKSERRPAFLERTGKLQVPYLEDPNTGTKLFESQDIVRYLEATYAV